MLYSARNREKCKSLKVSNPINSLKILRNILKYLILAVLGGGVLTAKITHLCRDNLLSEGPL